MRWSAIVFVGAIILTTTDAANAKKKEVSGLYPFPRVGRSDGFSLSTICKEVLKRQGLIPFPRVGRDFEYVSDKEQKGGGGLWFGPRLGRSTTEWHFPQINYEPEDYSVERYTDYLKIPQAEPEKSLQDPAK